ncbi:hypothetical protein DBR12_04805 [Acidovorax sp. HMWF029]|uniref:hypothetical protein n=1 Tax=Acidovorax sp. HMWF029 TaxID=2056863 RepID=UPI000D377822|nr:hypothetical protein [Acidovorax sp. HMWF029]PTT22084.1 hypothetical protein DBR12_04805 [Acidovorax sp. HMWF029]
MAALTGSLRPIAAPTPTDQLLPFEKALLQATASALQPAEAALLAKQVACINNIRRPSDWKRIEFQCKRWFQVRWPAPLLFARTDTFRIATIACQFGAKDALVDVWAEGGHVSALESSKGFSGLAI